MRALVPKALDEIEREMAEGPDRGRLALQLLKLAGVEAIGQPSAPVNTKQIIDDAWWLGASRRFRQEREKNKTDMDYLLPDDSSELCRRR